MIQDLWTSLLAFSGQFIVPDWGALVALIPIGIAAIVLLTTSWMVFRFATAGPTSRGIHKMPPVTPAGTHVTGPSVAPVLAALGVFMLLFGLFSGGIWLWVGIAALVIALVYWGGERLRNGGRHSGRDGGGTTEGTGGGSSDQGR